MDIDTIERGVRQINGEMIFWHHPRALLSISKISPKVDDKIFT